MRVNKRKLSADAMQAGMECEAQGYTTIAEINYQLAALHAGKRWQEITVKTK